MSTLLPTPAPTSAPARAPSLNLAAVNPVSPTAVDLGSAEGSALLHYTTAAGGYEVGRSYYGHARFVEYIPGTLPIVVTVPHGGYAAPEHIPDRVGGVHEPDIHTQELARLLGDAFSKQLGGVAGAEAARPHMIFNRLRRGRLDANRNEMDASGGHRETRLAWRQFHDFVRRAKREVVRGWSITNPAFQAHLSSLQQHPPPAPAPHAGPYSRGLLIDLHGQSHDHRHQLGMVLNQADLVGHTDEQLDRSGNLRDKCSLRAAVDCGEEGGCGGTDPSTCFGSKWQCGARACTPTCLSSVLRGARSLGALLESSGHPCVPSPTSPDAGRIMFFNGGYNCIVHGSSVMGAVQRQKEAAEKEKEKAAAVAAAAVASTAALSSSSSVAPVVDPDPAFSELFSSRLEGTHFLAIQIESAFEGHRDTPANMCRFADDLAAALITFVDWHVLREGERIPGKEIEA